MCVLELQETQNYVAQVWPVDSTQLDSWAYAFLKRWTVQSYSVQAYAEIEYLCLHEQND